MGGVNKLALSLELPVTEPPVWDTQTPQMRGAPMFNLRPEALFPITRSVSNLIGVAFTRPMGGYPVSEVTLNLTVATATAFWRHENAHFYIADRLGGEYGEHENRYNDAMIDAAGINANLAAADRIPLEAHDGIASDLDEIAATLDLPAYYLFQTKLDVSGGGNGDLAKVIEFQEGRGLSRVELATGLLALWQMADLFWWHNAPAINVIRYMTTGEQPRYP